MKYPLIIACSFLAAPTVIEDACDRKTVVDAFHCTADDQILLKKDLVSNVTYYACPECGVIGEEAGACDTCEVDLEKQKSGKDVCKQCYGKPEPREACKKTYYECEECGSLAPKAGACEDCETRRKKATSLALVRYRCEGCSSTSKVAAKCADDECERLDQELVQVCSESGKFPHVR